ncbi:multicopper oxidase family protein [Palleronia marisminoris]|uniref:multicopper oxidase family protein n=1 Tax=Palleronia marisminoris TaxID=315423 RepID=UPI001C31A880|nr:multicopper oxidase domain-containing protein [Palleronia marisminoris]
MNGLSPFASSAFAQDVPTGTPRSPLFGALPFSQPMPRLDLQKPRHLKAVARGAETDVHFPDGMKQPPGHRLSYHTDFTESGGTAFRNPYHNVGPMEGRPPGEYFAHQRWEEYLPEVGYVMTLGRCGTGVKFHPAMPDQGIDQVWSLSPNMRGRCTLPPPLIKLRYGEPALFRLYNRLHPNPTKNGGFGSNSQSTHNHNAHNASGSDGAANTHFYPGQFYDYHWTTTLARADLINQAATDRRASGPAKRGTGLERVPGDFRELQGTLWFHDHRFFYTAENVYKGHVGMLNYYSGPDRGHEGLSDGINLRLPSGTELDWGNIDFDVNLIISDGATDQDGQYFFDIFDTRGFCGDMMLVNFAYKPYFEVLPRKYRFRVLSAGMSRFVELGLLNPQGNPMPFQVIATDGNLLVNPVTVTRLDPMGPGERFDIVVDFSVFQRGSRITMINTLEHANGMKPKGSVSIADALRGVPDDPAVGGVMEFRIVDAVESVDNPGKIHRRGDPDRSRVPGQLTQPIPIVQPIRTRVIEWKGEADVGVGQTGECFPDCGEKEVFPWTVRINGVSQHFLNANRSSLLVPRPGEVEHWTLVNTSGSWSHPVHLHLEEGVTIDRAGGPMTAIERANPRKDVWRLGPDGGTTVNVQVRFGEFGGAYVSHCHNTVHEDFGMLFRFDVLTDPANPENSQVHVNVIPTPKPSPEGVTYVTPEILPEGNPFDPTFNPFPGRPV